MSKFVAGQVTKMLFLKLWITSFWTEMLLLNLLKRWCGNVNSTSERNYQTFNKIQEKSSFGRQVGGQEYDLQHCSHYHIYYFVEKSLNLLKRWCGNVNSTSERNYQTFNKIQEKSSFGRQVGGQEYDLQHCSQYHIYYFVEKSKCHKISTLNAFPLKCRVYDNFYALCQFFVVSRTPSHCLKEALVTRTLSASGLISY